MGNRSDWQRIAQKANRKRAERAAVRRYRASAEASADAVESTRRLIVGILRRDTYNVPPSDLFASYRRCYAEYLLRRDKPRGRRRTHLLAVLAFCDVRAW
jgi:hypothetical protein